MSAFAGNTERTRPANTPPSEGAPRSHPFLQQLQILTEQLPASWEIRSWSEFLDGIKLPSDVDVAIDRVKHNTAYYKSNYMCIFVVVFIVMSLFTLPVILVASGLWYVYTQRQDLIRPYIQHPQQQLQAGVGLVLAVALLSFSIMRLLRAGFVATAIAIIHGSVRTRKISMKVNNVVDGIQGYVDSIKAAVGVK